jgi:hypothetical protein
LFLCFHSSVYCRPVLLILLISTTIAVTQDTARTTSISEQGQHQTANERAKDISVELVSCLPHGFINGGLLLLPDAVQGLIGAQKKLAVEPPHEWWTPS